MKRHKYNAVKTTLDGITFASKAEAKRYAELKLLAEAGLIANLSLQPRFNCVVNEHKICTYVADFLYLESGKQVVEDVKGVKTPVYKLKKKLVEAIHNIKITEIGGS
tara:strand:- start:226 stop:546 length:321 start_codon:yes stop_codon:yes gene_type:complete